MTTPTAQRESDRHAQGHRAGHTIPQHQGAEAVLGVSSLTAGVPDLLRALAEAIDARQALIACERRLRRGE
jgi:hypothetical protein